MGDGSPPIGGGIGPHQMVGAHAAQVGSAFCSWVVGPHQLVVAWAPTKWWGPMQLKWALLPVHEWWAPPIGGGQWRSQYEARGKIPSLELPDWQWFYQLCCLNNKIIKISTHYHKLVFVLRKCSNTFLQQFRIQTIFRRQYHRTPVLVEGKGGEGKFVLRKCTETILQQCRIKNFFRGLHH